MDAVRGRGRRSAGSLAAGASALAVMVLAACSGGGGNPGAGASGIEPSLGSTSGDVAAGRAGDAGLTANDDDLASLGYTTYDAEPATLAPFAGRPLVLNFFASWCGPCRNEMPALEAVHQATKDEIGFLGLAVRDDEAAAQAMVDETGVTYHTGLDSEELLVDFDGFGMPTTVFFSATGELVDSHIGELSPGELRDKLAENFGIEP